MARHGWFLMSPGLLDGAVSVAILGGFQDVLSRSESRRWRGALHDALSNRGWLRSSTALIAGQAAIENAISIVRAWFAAAGSISKYADSKGCLATDETRMKHG